MGLFSPGLNPLESAYAQGGLEAASKAYKKVLNKYAKKRRQDKDVHEEAFEAAQKAATKYLLTQYAKQKGKTSSFLFKAATVGVGTVPKKVLDAILKAIGARTYGGIPANKLLGIRDRVAQTKAILSEYKRDAKMRDKAAKDLDKIKTKVIQELTKLMPKDKTTYLAKEIIPMFKLIRKAKDLDSMDVAIDEVMDMMIKKVTELTEKQIAKALKIRTFQSQSGRRVAASLYVNQQETISNIN